MRRIIFLVFFMATVIFGIAQKIVTGRVFDGSNSFPLEGATVIAKGSIEKKQTDENGIFKMNVPDSVKILVISYVGFEKKEVSIAGTEWLEISLEKSGFLNEVFVIGSRNRIRTKVETPAPIDGIPVARII